MADLKIVELGKISVDSGIVFIGDPFLQNLDESDFWNHIEETTENKNCNSSPIVKNGVVVPSGVGDGIYTVLAGVDEWGNIHSISIDFTSPVMMMLQHHMQIEEVVGSLIQVSSGLLYMGDPAYTICSCCGGSQLLEIAENSYSDVKETALYADEFDETEDVNFDNVTSGMCIPAGIGIGIYEVNLTVDDNGTVYSLSIEFSSPALDLVSGELNS